MDGLRHPFQGLHGVRTELGRSILIAPAVRLINVLTSKSGETLTSRDGIYLTPKEA